MNKVKKIGRKWQGQRDDCLKVLESNKAATRINKRRAKDREHAANKAATEELPNHKAASWADPTSDPVGDITNAVDHAREQYSLDMTAEGEQWHVEPNLDGMTVSELKAVAKDMGIKGRSVMTKSKLLAAIKEKVSQ